MSARVAPKILAIYSSYFRIVAKVQLQRTVASQQVLVKVTENYLFIPSRNSYNLCAVLGRENKGYRKKAVIKCHYLHSPPELYVINHQRFGIYMKVHNSVPRPKCYHLAATAISVGNVYNGASHGFESRIIHNDHVNLFF